MADESLAVLTCHRNSISEIFSANQINLGNNYSLSGNFDAYSFSELNTLVGLAFTAILAEGIHVDRYRSLFNIFIKYRNLIHSETNNIVTDAILKILKGGLAAFETLGYPHYFDDFIWAYHQILNSTHIIHPEARKKMKRILRDGF